MSNQKSNKIPDKTTLIQLERELQTLNEKLSILKAKGGFFRQFKIMNLESKIKKIDEEQFEKVDIHLYNEDAEYRKIGLSNLLLFKNPGFKLSVHIESNIVANYSRKLSGSIHSNGYSYLYSTRKNSTFEPFGQYKYPAAFVGHIDRWGRITLDISRSNSALFKNLPTEYEAHIDDVGNMLMECTSIENDFFSRGKNDIGKLIGRLIQDDVNLQQFAKNKEEMVARIETFRQDLLK